MGLIKTLHNEDIQTYLKKELSDLESELKERLIFETNLLIYNDIVSQIKTILDRQLLLPKRVATLKNLSKNIQNIDD